VIQPEIRYARSGDVDIAYFVIGDGPVDVVFVSGFISHLELLWEVSTFRHMYEELASFTRLVCFDKRGTGLSDRNVSFGSLAERMDDIRAVMDAAGMESAALFGVSEGGPLAMLFAGTYPERVTKLVLYGTYAGPDPRPGWEMTDAAVDQFVGFLREAWGTGTGLRMIMQDAPDDALPLLAKYERNSATPKQVAEIMRANITIDVRSIISSINVPTLVLHNTGDPLVNVSRGRYVAETIPSARLVEIDAAFHASWYGFPPEVGYAVREFLTGDTARVRTDRALATVLFTDIVSSTEHEAEVGDRRWRDLLDHHDRISQTQIDRYSGRLVKTTGDGVLATFDGPGRGIDCARAIRSSIEPLGLRIRAGLHTGEVELRGNDIAGLGVVIARRVCDIATSGEIYATRTVKDLVAGSGLAFAERGTHQLKGVPDDWQIFAAV
jgi:class 3 adenylate cyclase/alpha-beta hydrolase superfamily lysophospholipase